MAIDVLQEKIRKMKNPSMVDLALDAGDLPPYLIQEEGSSAKAYGRFCRELLDGLKGIIPAVRVSFSAFGLLGAEGMAQLTQVLQYAAEQGYYVAMEGPYLLSPMMAAAAAESIFAENAVYPCDGLILSGYPGSDVIKPFLPCVRERKKDIFPVVRTSNKSAPEIQDLLTGTRLVHAAAADLINRFSGEGLGKYGYSGVGVVAGASSAESLRVLRTKYPRLFLLLDDMDYSCCNAKICGSAFDKFGHGAVACVGPTITTAWKQTESDGSDYVAHATAAAERVKKNLTRYTTVL